MEEPKWTVHYNIVSPESDRWVGTGWEFFDNEADAQTAYERHQTLGNVPGKRPFHGGVDRQHLGAAHLFRRR